MAKVRVGSGRGRGTDRDIRRGGERREGRRVGMLAVEWLLVLLLPQFSVGTENPDPCDSNVCTNGGTCTTNGDGHGCECAAGWAGDTCEEVACSANSTCSSRDMCSRLAGAPSAEACAAVTTAAAVAACGVSSCAPEFCALGKETPGYVTANRPGLGLPPLGLPPLGLPPLGRVTVDSFLRASADQAPEYADVGAVTCAAGYGLNAACRFVRGRASGATTRVPVLHATTQEECAERVMSQHSSATGAAFQVDIHGVTWCDALFNMTKCDLAPCAFPDAVCTVQLSAVDQARPSAFEGNGQLYAGYECSVGAPTNCTGYVCPATATTRDDLDGDAGSIVCPESGCTDTVCCTGRAELETKVLCSFSDLPQASCAGNPTDDHISFSDQTQLLTSMGCYVEEQVEGDSCSRWSGGVLGPDGGVYGIPYDAQHLLRVGEPRAGEMFPTIAVDQVGYPQLLSGAKWSGGVLAPTGRIIGVPHNSRHLLIIFPGEVMALMTPNAGLETIKSYSGGALAPNGKIYCAPGNAESVLVIDPARVEQNNEFCGNPACDTTSIPVSTCVNGCRDEWSDVVLAGDGKLYFIPFMSNAVMIIDPANNDLIDSASISSSSSTVDVDVRNQLAGSNKWSGGVLGANGKVYGIPAGGLQGVLVIDPTTTTPTASVIGVFNNKWTGGVLAPNGKIYGIPLDSDTVLMITPAEQDTAQDTASEVQFNAQLGVQNDPNTIDRGRWDGGILGRDGRIVFMPGTAARFVVLTPSVREFGFTGCVFNCPEDSYKSLQEANCTACPEHSSTVNTTGRKQISDCLCDPGYTLLIDSAGDRSCTACETGTYKASSGDAACTSCPDNTHTLGSGQSFCQCNVGSEPMLEEGWNVVLKTSGNGSFAYDSPLWTQSHVASVLNPESPLTDIGDAKYPTYNTLSFSEIRLCTSRSTFSQRDCVTHALSAPVPNAAALFGADTLREGVQRNLFAARFAAYQSPPPGAVMVGTATAGSMKRWITFGSPQRRFNAPVVILGIPPKLTESAAAIVLRISEVTSDSFSVHVDVPSRPSSFGGICGTDNHADLNFSWAVVSSGVYENGTHGEALHAGRHVSAENFSWSNVNFSRSFSTDPAVLSQVQTSREDDWVKTRQQIVTTTGFQVRLEGIKGHWVYTDRANETIGWLAVARGVSNMFGRRFEARSIQVDATAGAVVHFGRGFIDSPAVFGSVATFHEDDEVHLRLAVGTVTNASQATLVLEEEQCGDSEVAHVSEDVHVVAISADSFLAGIECSNLQVALVDQQGFNVECHGGVHRARWGFCSDGPDVTCSNNDGSDGSVGIGLSHGVGAGSVRHLPFPNSSTRATDSAIGALEVSTLQAWVLVRNSEERTPPTSTCSSCAVNAYKPVAGSTTCTQCPNHTSTDGATGSTYATNCTCTKGYFAHMDGIACSPCPENTYKSIAGSSNCLDCPSYSTTGGATGASSIEECLCNPGYRATFSGAIRECSECPSDMYKCEPGPGECHACPEHSSTYGATAAQSIQECQVAAGYTTTSYRGAGALGPGSLLDRFTENLNGWNGGQNESCGKFGTVLRLAATSTRFTKTFALPEESTHNLLHVDLDLVMIDATFVDAGSVHATVSIDGTPATVSIDDAGGTLWSRDDLWSCADILRTNPQAVSGKYNIFVPGASETRVYCDMVNDGGGWVLVQRTLGPLVVSSDQAINATLLMEMGNATNAKLSRATIVQLCSQQYKIETEDRNLYCTFDDVHTYCDQCSSSGKQCSATFNNTDNALADPILRGTGFAFSDDFPYNSRTGAWTNVWCRSHQATDSSANQCGEGAAEVVQHISADIVLTSVGTSTNVTVDVQPDSSSEQHAGIAFTNFRILPGWLDHFEGRTESNTWLARRTTKLYVNDTMWPTPSWFTRSVEKPPETFSFTSAECSTACGLQHNKYELFGQQLEVDCTHSEIRQDQREGISASQCYLQTMPDLLRVSLCSDFGTVLGGYSVVGAGGGVYRHYNLSLYPHDELTVSFDFIKIDLWDSRNASAYIDGKVMWSRGFSSSEGQPVCGTAGAGAGKEVKVSVGPFVLSHSSSTLEIRVETEALGGGRQAFFAIDNVRVVPQLRWSTACKRTGYKGTTGNHQCTPCPDNSRTRERGALQLTSCICDVEYAGTIEVATDRCSPLPKSKAVSGGANAPTVRVAWQPTSDRPPNYNERLVIFGNVTSSSTGNLLWTAFNSNSGVQLDLGEIAATPIDASMYIETNQVFPLVVRADTLSPADGVGSLTFRLTAAAGDLISYAEVAVTLNSPPADGWLESIPANGTAIDTIYRLSAVGWIDTDLPMTYRLFTADKAGNHVVLAKASNSSYVSTILSSGALEDGYSVTYGARVTDAFGGSAVAMDTTVVMPYVLPVDHDAAMFEAERMLDVAAGSDSFAVQSLVSALSSSIGTERSNETVEMRTLLVTRLEASIASMSTGAEKWAADAVSGCLGTVVAVTSSANQMSSEATDGALNVLKSLAEHLQPSDASIAGNAVASLLGATEAVARNEARGDGSENAAAAQRAVQLSNVLDRVSVSLGSDLVAGERPAVIATDRFKLSAHAGQMGIGMQVDAAAGSGRRRRLIDAPGGASVEFAPGAMEGRPTSVTQMVEWEGPGPHFWAGINLTTSRDWARSHEDLTTMGSSVLTISFFNDTGGKVDVDGLATPAIVSLVVPEREATGGIRKQLQQLSLEELRKRAKAFNATGVDLVESKQQMIELLLDIPEIALVGSAIYCTYWDTASLQWQVDGAGALRRVGDTFIADCSTSHFTDFAAFMGPLPQMNRLGALSDLPSNPTGMKVTAVMLGLILFMLGFGCAEYRWLVRGLEASSTPDQRLREHKERHDRNVVYFARYRRLYDDVSIPWTHRALIGLRTRWLVGGCLCTVKGDPYQRSQRLFILSVHVLLVMTINIAFFDDHDECVYPCDAHMPAGMDDSTTTDPACVACPVEEDWQMCGLGANAPVEGARECRQEELPGITTSLITVLIVVPIIGLVNLLFAWLRKPLVADVMVHSGEMWARLQSESNSVRARKRESQMLAAMTPKQVIDYAQEIVDLTTQKQRVDPGVFKQIMETTQQEQSDELNRLDAELKEHVANHKKNMYPTTSHQACMKAIFMTEQLIERRQKQKLSKLMLEDHEKATRSNLTRELNELPLQQLRERQRKHRIKFAVEDEDAWTHGGVHDHSSAEDALFLSEEEKHMVKEHQKEAQAQIDNEKRMLVELIANAELRSLGKRQRFCRRIKASRPIYTLKNCLTTQRHCCTTLCPWCASTITATFEEEGPLGLKFAADGAYVKVVAIKEYYQADENDRIHVGLVLRAINGNDVNSTHRHDILRMLHSAGRPATLVFGTGSGNDDLDTSDSEDDDQFDDDAAGGVDAFWDDDKIHEAVVVEDIEAPTAIEIDNSVSREETIQVSLQLREYGVALIARQRLADEVASMEADVAGSSGGSNRAQKVKELNEKRDGLTAAENHAIVAAASAGYDFAKCTVHVERIPDSLGQEGIDSLFSAFGRVVQVTVQRRPGANSNWALVTMSNIDCVRSILTYSQGSNIELSEQQQMQLQRIEMLQASELYSSSYGRSWLEANERAEASIRGLALINGAQVRNDFGVFVSSAQIEHAAPRRRAPVCKRRRQVAAQMRVCETAVDALFYACDRDNSGTLDREELAILMAELNGGPRVGEFAVQFVIDQVQSHGDGAITREALKPAITLWRYLQHEQDYVAKEFDAFDKRTRGKIIGKNEVGLLLKRLNSDKDHPEGMAPSVAEVEWVIKKAQRSGGGGVGRAELRAAVALWYPYVYNRRRVEDLPATAPSKAGRRRRALAGMLSVHKHHVKIVLTSRYPSVPDPDNPARIKTYKLTMSDLRLTMSALISSIGRREQVSEEELEFVASIADLQGATTFETTDIQAALAMWLCTRDVQADLTASLQQYDDAKTGSAQWQQVNRILTELNDGIPVTSTETDWILESSDIDGNGTISREELRGSLGWWFLHVSRGRTLEIKRGWAAALPWLMSAAVGLVCTYLVAATSVRFTEEKTQRWLNNTILAVVFKQLMVDPLKVLFCGTLLEPVATLFSLDMGLGEIDLSEALGESMEDFAEDAVDSIASMMVLQSLAGGGGRNGEADTAKKMRKDAHENAFLAGSRSVAKMKSMARTKQVRSHALQAATEAARDSQRTLQRLRSQRAEMNSVYAKKIAEKRLKQGLNRGTYAARAEADMVAVSQFMAAEHDTARKELREVDAEIKDLQAQEEQLLSAPGTSQRELKIIRDRLARADARRRIIADRQGDLEHEEGNEKLLLAKAKREDDEHHRHISHLQGLSSAKTRERVRRKRDEKRGVVPQEDAGAVLSRSRWRKGQQGKNIVGLARMVTGGGQVAVRAETPAAGDPVDVDEMTSVMLADAGLRRSGTRPKQLKVAMTVGPLPGAAPQRSLIDEVDEIVAEQGMSTLTP